MAAAAGFRVFIPLLVMSIVAKAGVIELSVGFAWVTSNAALIAFLIAAIVEVAAYYLPIIDNGLDMIASPLAVIAGIVLTAAVIADIDPLFKWTMAIIAGGGVSATVQAKTVITRAASTVTTAGIANPILSTVELGGALLTSVLAIFLPILGLLFAGGILVWLFVRTRKKITGTD